MGYFHANHANLKVRLEQGKKKKNEKGSRFTENISDMHLDTSLRMLPRAEGEMLQLFPIQNSPLAKTAAEMQR